ncbi:MAG: carboxypeptidase-like regulatory domain-containing protein, partial [Bacteroidales bacterium]|nr:carboxypeptidase-like regulatory domain-containing protein [Bacteroidales bacterium]
MKKITLFFLLSSLYFILEAQNDTLTLHMEQASFREFVDSVEGKTNYKIYFANDWVDSLNIYIDADKQSIDQILDKNLADSGFTFIITPENKIILSKGYTIKTSFKEEYEKYLSDHIVKIDSSIYALPENKLEEDKIISDEFKLFKIGNPSELNNGKFAVLSGYIKEADTGIPVVGGVIYVEKIKVGATSNADGFYSLSLPKGQHIVEFRTIGMRTTRRNLILYSNGEFDVEMYEKVNQLEEVTITANKENNVQNLRMGTEKISIKMLKMIPMGLGEVDVIKSSLLLPGVQSVGEAAAGFNVRGGATDQNLMLLNNAPIINPSHFFGFFSAFNSDIIGDVTLYKSGVPAEYGGRISSVMDIQLKEGSKEKFKVSGGISPVTGRLMVEGPVKEKATYILSARTTYSNWILKQLENKQLQNSTASFYDIQGMTNIEIDKNNKISLSGYYSKDKFNYYKQSAFEYSNLAATLRWDHTFKPNLFASFSVIMSNYDYGINAVQDSTAMSSMYYRLGQNIGRADFTYFPIEKHKVNFGLNATWYRLSPGELLPLNDSSSVMPRKLEDDRALESSLYLSDEFEISPSITLSAGLRFNMYASFGPNSEFIYGEGLPFSTESIIDTAYYSNGQVKAFYPNLEFRFSSRFLLGDGFSFKAGIQRMYQYIQMISNTTAISPTDIWKLSDNHIKPQRSDQLSFGIYRNFKKNMIETSIETYYKKLNNIIDYKGGAQLLMNEHLETDIINGTGHAYGIELMVKKTRGSITGWISYTYARILHKIDGEFAEEKVNDGNYFPANYDKPNDFKLVVNSKLSRRFNITTNFVYNTGRPITYPVGFYDFANVNRVFYSQRNEFRVPDYLRLDLAATLNGNLRKNKL